MFYRDTFPRPELWLGVRTRLSSLDTRPWAGHENRNRLQVILRGYP